MKKVKAIDGVSQELVKGSVSGQKMSDEEIRSFIKDDLGRIVGLIGIIFDNNVIMDAIVMHFKMKIDSNVSQQVADAINEQLAQPKEN